VNGREYYRDEQVTLWLGDALDVLRALPDESVDCIVTSPPYYGLRDYGVDGQYGLEATPAAYVETMRQVFAEARRVLAKDGTCWINLGDSYARGNTGQGNDGPSSTLQGGTRPSFRSDGATVSPAKRAGAGIPDKNLLMIPERVAIALQDDGWILRSKVIWHKPNAMPESVLDRPAGRYEFVYLLTRSERYWFDLDTIREPHTMEQRRRTVKHRYNPPASQPEHTGLHTVRAEVAPDGHPLGRNPGDVWTIATQPYPEAHFAVFPAEIPIRCIKAGCKPGGTVLDPFSGSGTAGEAARRLGRRYLGIDLNPAYHDLAIKRYAQGVLDLSAGAA
jgi:site-specific DNA-methyltransferase (cytosine-N4-specific)